MSSLTLGRGTLTPVFDPAVTEYQASVPYSATTITVRPVLEESHATVTVNGEAVVDGQDSKPVALSVGKNTVTIEVTAENGVAKMTYAVTVTRRDAEPPPPPPTASGDYIPPGSGGTVELGNEVEVEIPAGAIDSAIAVEVKHES